MGKHQLYTVFFFSPSHFPDFTGGAGQTVPGSDLKQLGEVISVCVRAVIELRLGELCALETFHRRIKKKKKCSWTRTAHAPAG